MRTGQPSITCISCRSTVAERKLTRCETCKRALCVHLLGNGSKVCWSCRKPAACEHGTMKGFRCGRCFREESRRVEEHIRRNPPTWLQ